MTFYASPPPAPAGSSPRSTSSRSARRASRRPRSAPAPTVRILHAGRGAGPRGAREVLAQDPNVKRLVFKVGRRTSHAPGHAQAGRGGHRLRDQGELAEEIRRTPGLTLKPTPIESRTACSSPTSGTRSRPGTTGACAWPRTTPSTARPINQAEALGLSKITADHSARVSTSTGSPRCPVRSGEGQAAPRRGGLSQRLRRRRVWSDAADRHSRGRRQRPPRRRVYGRTIRPMERAAFFTGC